MARGRAGARGHAAKCVARQRDGDETSDLCTDFSTEIVDNPRAAAAARAPPASAYPLPINEMRAL